MRLINVNAFLCRETVMNTGGTVDRRRKVLECCDDESTKYAILSHRWIDSMEVDYEEIVDLEKMNVEDREDIRQRLGYKKILNTCEQAQRDDYEWVWVDTCCIDKRSSAELSEAINSMYRLYANSRVCYAYLHDVQDPSFPTERDHANYPKSNGWPEWFSRGWTLQEMIAPSNIQFFNKNWQIIGDKKAHACALEVITQVPVHILTQGLFGRRPCVAQIMSWAASRKTTRVEDRAYSLMGLLDVNMPMLYGEGKKAFHRLQLEIIRSSNDQSIFAWGWTEGIPEDMRPGSILADDPSFFGSCSYLEPLNHEEFIHTLKRSFPNVELPSIDPDCFDTFPITNRGIHMWMVLRPYRDSDSTVFQAFLPCRNERGSLVTIGLALWNSNCYRFPQALPFQFKDSLQFVQVHLRYQDMPWDVTFEIDDSQVTENGFICSDVYPSEHRGNTFTLAAMSPVCIRTYSKFLRSFSVAFGQCFGQDWIHVIDDPPEVFSEFNTGGLVAKGPDCSQNMADMYSRDDCRRSMSTRYMRLPGSNWMLRTCRFVWERWRIQIRMEVFRSSHFGNGLDEWKVFTLERVGDPSRDMIFMLPDMPCNSKLKLQVDGVMVEFSPAPQGVQFGDYGYFSESGDFHCQGNIFAAIRTLVPGMDNIPRQPYVKMNSKYFPLRVVDDRGLSLPSDHAFNLALTFLSPQLTNTYLVTRVVECCSYIERTNMVYCTIRKPLIWHQDDVTPLASV